MELGAEPIQEAPGAPEGLKLSNDGNWKGSETGTRPPNIPKPRGSVEGLPRSADPAVETWTKGKPCFHKETQLKLLYLVLKLTCERCDVVDDVVKVPEADQPFPALEPWLAPPTILCLCP